MTDFETWMGRCQILFKEIFGVTPDKVLISPMEWKHWFNHRFPPEETMGFVVKRLINASDGKLIRTSLIEARTRKKRIKD